MQLKKDKKIFFIGICGSGMKPLALLLHANGFCVSGSELYTSKALEQLKEKGLNVFESHKSSNIEDSDYVVYSSAIPKNNPEILEAKKLGKILWHRSDLLKEFINNFPSITVAGTHGKTSSTALICHTLNSLKDKPSIITLLGGKMTSSFEENRLEDVDFIVAEADESDGSFTKYISDIVVLTNIDPDHLDYYKSYENILSHFKIFSSSLKGLKTLIYNADHQECEKIAKTFTMKKIGFGIKQGDIKAENIEPAGQKTFFDLVVGSIRKKICLPLIGSHNVLNALSAASVLSSLGHNLFEISSSLETYKGTKRRLELLYQKDNLFFYDDYAHNPGKVKATLSALKLHFPEYKIIALFEPHRYSRISSLYSDFVSSFHEADITLVFPTFCAGEPLSLKNYSEENLAFDISKHCQNSAQTVYNVEEAYNLLKRVIAGKTIITSLGAGSISHLATQIREKIKCDSSLSTEAS